MNTAASSHQKRLSQVEESEAGVTDMQAHDSGAGRVRNRESNVLILFLGKDRTALHFRGVNLRPAIILFLLLTVSTAKALTIVGYNPATNDRFSSGYPLSPAENTSAAFLGNGYDLSGVGWNPDSPKSNFAMISDQYFVYSTHAGPGSTMSFFSPTQNSVVTYGVSGTYHFTFNGQASDFSVGRLSSPIDAAYGITTYPILDLPTIQSYLGLPVLIYGHGGSVSSSPRLGAVTDEGQ